MGEESHINNSVQFSTLPIPMHCHLETTCTLTLPHRRCTGLVNAVDCNRERQTVLETPLKNAFIFISRYLTLQKSYLLPSLKPPQVVTVDPKLAGLNESLQKYSK